MPSAARVDVNGAVRRHLGARKVSFAPMETTVELTGMEYGDITPLGLPDDWPLLVDTAVRDMPYVLIGSGRRRGKLIAPGSCSRRSPVPNWSTASPSDGPRQQGGRAALLARGGQMRRAQVQAPIPWILASLLAVAICCAFVARSARGAYLRPPAAFQLDWVNCKPP